VQAFHNLLVIEKGDNTEPSNFAWDAANPHAAEARAAIEAELARTPTAPGFAGLIRLLELCGERERAEAVARAALQHFPRSPTLLLAAIGVLGDGEERRAAIDALAAAEGPASAALIEGLRGGG
jgi:hypothetical protein